MWIWTLAGAHIFSSLSLFPFLFYYQEDLCNGGVDWILIFFLTCFVTKLQAGDPEKLLYQWFSLCLHSLIFLCWVVCYFSSKHIVHADQLGPLILSMGLHHYLTSLTWIPPLYWQHLPVLFLPLPKSGLKQLSPCTSVLQPPGSNILQSLLRFLLRHCQNNLLCLMCVCLVLKSFVMATLSACISLGPHQLFTSFALIYVYIPSRPLCSTRMLPDGPYTTLQKIPNKAPNTCLFFPIWHLGLMKRNKKK